MVQRLRQGQKKKEATWSRKKKKRQGREKLETRRGRNESVESEFQRSLCSDSHVQEPKPQKRVEKEEEGRGVEKENRRGYVD